MWAGQAKAAPLWLVRALAPAQVACCALLRPSLQANRLASARCLPRMLPASTHAAAIGSASQAAPPIPVTATTECSQPNRAKQSGHHARQLSHLLQHHCPGNQPPHHPPHLVHNIQSAAAGTRLKPQHGLELTMRASASASSSTMSCFSSSALRRASSSAFLRSLRLSSASPCE